MSGIYIVKSPAESYVHLDSGEHIPVSLSNRALHQDRVYYKLLESTESDSRVSAHITGIVERANSTIPGTLVLNQTKIIGFTRKKHPIYEFVPLDWRYPSFYVSSTTKSRQCLYGLVKFKEWERTQRMPHGILLDILGSVSEREAEVLALLHKHGLFIKSHELHSKSGGLLQIIPDKAVRKDLTYCPVLSIDPPGCRDIDDAFHLETGHDGEHYLYVHIADVDATFQKDSPYDPEIRKRLTTIYTPTKIYHMIPPLYASDKCSLLPNAVRSAVTVKFICRTDGQIDFENIFLSLIRSRRALTYEEADKILATEDRDGDRDQREKQDLMRTLEIELRKTATLLGTSDSHNLVEKLMILTNHHVAKFIEGRFCRIQRGKESCDENASIHWDINSKIDSELAEYLSVRTEERAQYAVSPVDTRHSHMGLSIYTHFTSPIRRYADLTVHRLVKEKLCECLVSAGETLSRLTDDYLETLANDINEYTGHTKKFYRDLAILDLIDHVRSVGKLKVHGYLTDYKKGKMVLYLSQFKVEYKYRICHPKLLEANLIQIRWQDHCLSILKDGFPIKSWQPYEKIHLTLQYRDSFQFQNKLIATLDDSFLSDITLSDSSLEQGSLVSLS